MALGVFAQANCSMVYVYEYLDLQVQVQVKEYRKMEPTASGTVLQTGTEIHGTTAMTYHTIQLTNFHLP